MDIHNEETNQCNAIKDPIIEFSIKQRRFGITACHLLPGRTFYFRGKPFLCYRCLGLNLGFFLAILIATMDLILPSSFIIGILARVGITSIGLLFLFAIALQIPFVIDGSVQALWSKYKSNNPLRLISGFLGGLGQFLLIFSIGRFVKLLLA